jgi:hypothetical protein
MAKSRVQRIRSLANAFERIRVGVIMTDTLLNTYFDNKATEIEAFNADLGDALTTKEEIAETTETVRAAKKRRKN